MLSFDGGMIFYGGINLGVLVMRNKRFHDALLTKQLKRNTCIMVYVITKNS